MLKRLAEIYTTNGTKNKIIYRCSEPKRNGQTVLVSCQLTTTEDILDVKHFKGILGLEARKLQIFVLNNYLLSFQARRRMAK